MAVFIEFVSIIVRLEAARRVAPEVWTMLVSEPFGPAHGADGEIGHEGFMSGHDAADFARELVRCGLKEGVDFAGADELCGTSSDWLEVGEFELSSGRTYAACRLVGSRLGYCIGYDGDRQEGVFRASGTPGDEAPSPPRPHPRQYRPRRGR